MCCSPDFTGGLKTTRRYWHTHTHGSPFLSGAPLQGCATFSKFLFLSGGLWHSNHLLAISYCVLMANLKKSLLSVWRSKPFSRGKIKKKCFSNHFHWGKVRMLWLHSVRMCFNILISIWWHTQVDRWKWMRRLPFPGGPCAEAVNCGTQIMPPALFGFKKKKNGTFKNEWMVVILLQGINHLCREKNVYMNFGESYPAGNDDLHHKKWILRCYLPLRRIVKKKAKECDAKGVRF